MGLEYHPWAAAEVPGETVDLLGEPPPASLAREVAEIADAVGNGAVAVQPVEQHPDATLLCLPIQAPVQEEIGGVEGLILLLEDALGILQGIEQIAPHKVVPKPSGGEDGLDVLTLVTLGDIIEHRRERMQRSSAVLLEQPPRDAHDGRRLQSARQHRPHGERAAQPAPYGLREDLPERLSVLGVGLHPDLARRIERPVPLHAHAAPAHRHPVRRRQPHDLLVERDLLVLEQGHEVVGDAYFVQTTRHVREREQPLDLRREAEQPARRVVVVERLDAEMVARAEQRRAARVPDGKREVAQQVLRATLAPALVGGEDELSVRDRAGRTEHGAEVGAVVDARVRREDERAVGARERGEEIEQVGLEPVVSDVVLGEQLVPQGGDADGLLDEGPDARANPIEGVVDARLELEHRGFACEVAGNLASSRDDDRLQRQRVHPISKADHASSCTRLQVGGPGGRDAAAGRRRAGRPWSRGGASYPLATRYKSVAFRALAGPPVAGIFSPPRSPPHAPLSAATRCSVPVVGRRAQGDRKSTRLNSSHGYISYAVFCLKKKNKNSAKPLNTAYV